LTAKANIVSLIAKSEVRPRSALQIHSNVFMPEDRALTSDCSCYATKDEAMPILEDPRQERFAQLVAGGATRGGAYRGAGYKGKGAAHGASAVMRREGVRDRIEELQAEQIKDLRQRQAKAAEAEQIDGDWLLRRGARLLDAAQDDKHYTAASQTLERIARICGCWDRSEPEGDQVIRIYSDRPLTEEEWLRMYAPHNLEAPDDPARSN
jgi:hypothetical protein